MLPLTLETRTSKVHITISYRASLKDVCLCDMSILTDAYTMIASTSHDALEQPCVKGNAYIENVTNDNGQCLLPLCHSAGICVVNTWYPRKTIHQWTWYSSDGTMKKVIDHILILKCWQTCINNFRVYRGAQISNTDHWLLITNIRIKLKADHSIRTKTWLDLSHLQDPQIQVTYSCSTANGFNTI